MLTCRPIRAVLFDWDGTLLDSYSADARVYAQMFQALEMDWDVDNLARHYSPDWHNVYRAAGLPMERWKEADHWWRHFYRSQRPALQPGTRNAIHKLYSRYRLGLVSGGSAWRVRAQLGTFGLGHFFTVSVFGDEIPRRKPHPAQLKIALGRLGIEPASAVYVGDTPEDVIMAKRAGVAVVGVVGNSPVAERLLAARPQFVIPNLAALPTLFWRR
jgi:pyrophosphatase PpaX